MEYWLNIENETTTGLGLGPNSARADARSRGHKPARTVRTDAAGHESAIVRLGGRSTLCLAEITVMDALNLHSAPTLPSPGFEYSEAVAHQAINNGSRPSDNSFAFRDRSAIIVEEGFGRARMWIRLPA